MPDSAADIQYLTSIASVRESCSRVFDLAQNSSLTYWDLDLSKEQDCIDYCAKLLERDFGENYESIPPHSRWRHFGDRLDPVISQWRDENMPSIEIGRKLIDLFVVSVLLDAGAGPHWTYKEVGKTDAQPIGRSEGLAVASLDMWKQGLFSGKPQDDPLRVDALGLSRLTVDSVKSAMQVDEQSNPMVGIDGRAQLLVKLGQVLQENDNASYFGLSDTKVDPVERRPGYLLDYLAANKDSKRLPSASSTRMSVDLPVLWKIIIEGLGGVWPATRTKLHGRALGDVWPCQALESSATRPAESLIPFHKLSQWLTYSLLEILEKELKWHVSGSEAMTGLPEYRNGGLLIDIGVMKLKEDAVRQSLSLSPGTKLPPLPASHPAIVEWRACTVIMLDRIRSGINNKLGTDLSLPQVLESCTWKGGREIAKEKRAGGGPPIDVELDGTVF